METTPGSNDSKKSPSSVRKPKGPKTAGPLLGSAAGDETGPALRALSATNAATDQAEPASTPEPRHLQWTAAGEGSGDSSTSPKTAANGWHARN
jgi:hypothetical protein